MILKLIGGVVILLLILAGIYWIADNIRLNKKKIKGTKK